VIRRVSLLAFASLLLLLAAARPARAQFDGGVTGVGALAPADFFIGIQRENGVNLTDFEVERFFNKANCDCNTPVFIFVTLLPSGFAKRNIGMQGNMDFWIGSDCANPTTRALGKCDLLQSLTLTTFLQNGKATIQTDARVISTNTALTTVDSDGGSVNTPTVGTFTPTPDCTSTTQKFAQTVWALVDYGSDGVYDVSVTRAVDVRLVPPPGPDPAQTRLDPGNEALVMSWAQVDSSIYPDLQGYQILCQRGPGLQVFADGTFSPGFQTCPTTQTGTAVAGLDPLFTCSPLLGRTTQSFRIEILQNAIVYGAAVVSVDISGNASAPDILFAAPVKTKSFYDVYRTPDGKAAGGFCAVGPGRSTGAATACGAAGASALAIALTVRRRRRRSKP